MAIWNGTQADDLVTGLLAAAFPQINETTELAKLSPAELQSLQLRCEEANDLVAAQVRAVADMLCHVDQGALEPGTVNALAWGIKALLAQRDIAARIGMTAGYASDPDIRRAASLAQTSAAAPSPREPAH